ncbi:MAG: hypothetical protein HY907_11160 [Deltaproteobacteria bacterium]|nr:hypothetical protein [Deltaproteobacteria bacterium]
MRGKALLVVAPAVFLAAGWSAAQDASGEAWDLGVSGDDETAKEPEEPAPSLEGLDLPPEAGPAEVLAALRRRCGPPSLAEALDAAVAVAGLDPAAEQDLVDQARWAAALPRVRVSLRRTWEHDESLDLEPDPQDGNYGVDTDDDFEVGVTAQWDLGAIVAPPEAAAARRLELEAAAARQALRVEVTRTYFERCLLRLEWAAGPRDAARRAELAWDLADCEARLDALTGGLLGEVAPGEEPEEREPSWSSEGTAGTR